MLIARKKDEWKTRNEETRNRDRKNPRPEDRQKTIETCTLCKGHKRNAAKQGKPIRIRSCIAGETQLYDERMRRRSENVCGDGRVGRNKDQIIGRTQPPSTYRPNANSTSSHCMDSSVHSLQIIPSIEENMIGCACYAAQYQGRQWEN